MNAVILDCIFLFLILSCRNCSIPAKLKMCSDQCPTRTQKTGVKFSVHPFLKNVCSFLFTIQIRTGQ